MVLHARKRKKNKSFPKIFVSLDCVTPSLMKKLKTLIIVGNDLKQSWKQRTCSRTVSRGEVKGFLLPKKHYNRNTIK